MVRIELKTQNRKMEEHVPNDPLFVLKVTTDCWTRLQKLEEGLLECHGTVSVEVNEEKKEVRVRGKVKPLELIMKTHAIMGEKARLCYYNEDPAGIDDFKSESNGKEKEECSGGKREEEEEDDDDDEEEEEDHYKPNVYKEHKPVYYPSSISGKEFFDYFGCVRSETHKRNGAPSVDPFAESPGYSRSKHSTTAFQMRRPAHPPHFY